MRTGSSRSLFSSVYCSTPSTACGLPSSTCFPGCWNISGKPSGWNGRSSCRFLAIAVFVILTLGAGRLTWQAQNRELFPYTSVVSTSKWSCGSSHVSPRWRCMRLILFAIIGALVMGARNEMNFADVLRWGFMPNVHPCAKHERAGPGALVHSVLAAGGAARCCWSPWHTACTDWW